MIRRRTLLTTALATATTIGLAACRDDDSTADASNASDGGGKGKGVLKTVTIGKDLDKAPTVKFSAPLEITRPESKIVVKGDGKTLTKGQTAVVHSAYVDAGTGKLLQSTWKGAPSTGLTIDQKVIGKEAATFLTTVPQGSRFAMTGWQQSQQGQMVSLVQVADVVGVTLPRATGKKQDPDPDLPAYTLGKKGAPKLSGKPSMTAPKKTMRHVAITGSGEKTAAGDTLFMHYTGWKLSDGSVFDSSWKKGTPFSFVLGKKQVIPGWDDHLEGLPVGSQVLLVVPPSEGYGGSGNELDKETLVFVADILFSAPPVKS